LDWARLCHRYGIDCLVQYESSLRELSEEGLVEWNDSTVRLSPAGMLLSNEIFQRFI
jgi:coproporphyrinogen III oxidase-like Fe-S oxidoreductase